MMMGKGRGGVVSEVRVRSHSRFCSCTCPISCLATRPLPGHSPVALWECHPSLMALGPSEKSPSLCRRQAHPGLRLSTCPCSSWRERKENTKSKLVLNMSNKKKIKPLESLDHITAFFLTCFLRSLPSPRLPQKTLCAGAATPQLSFGAVVSTSLLCCCFSGPSQGCFSP